MKFSKEGIMHLLGFLLIFCLFSNFTSALNIKHIVKSNETVQLSLSFNGIPAIKRILNLINGTGVHDCREIMGRPKDCNGIPDACPSGVYMIYPRHSAGFKTYCEMSEDGGHWTIRKTLYVKILKVFQRRKNGYTNFYRNWIDYQNGFGNPKAEFWLGNNRLNKITEQGKYELRIDLKDFDGNSAFAKYGEFKVGDEHCNYKLTAKGYYGTAGDSLYLHDGQSFSTKDRDNDIDGINCAKMFKGAWWFTGCVMADLNGEYYIKKPSQLHHGVYWRSWKGHNYSLKSSVMMMRLLQ